MKLFKRVFPLMLLIALTAFGCERVSVSPEDNSQKIELQDVPVAVTDYVDQNFQGLTIVKVEKKLNDDGSFKKYEVYLSNGVELYFDANWNQIFDDSSSSGTDDSFDIDYADLPQNVKDYMSQYYPNADVDRVKKKINDDGSPRSYEIRLSDDTKLYFNGSGQFIGIDD